MHTPGPWKWWTSNSWKRLGADLEHGRTKFVLEPYVCRDGHPDLIVSKEDMALIAAAPDFYHAATTGAQVNLPDFLEWIAARLIRLGDNPNADFVLTLRDRAKLLRAAIAKAEDQ